MNEASPENKMLTPAEVAQAFGVDPKTVTRWAKAGKITAYKTLGGHRRFKHADVAALLEPAQEGGGDQ